MIFRIQKIISQGAKLTELALFPSFCKICERLLESPGERVLCRSCLNKITPSRPSSCPCCGRFYEGVGDPHLCSSCLKEPPPFSMQRSCAKYRGELKDVLLLYKYRRFRTLGKNLARFAYDTLKKEEKLWWGVDMIVPVPLHPRRKKERGFNQAEIMARELSRLGGIPLETDVLEKNRHVPPQTSLEEEERIKNVRDAFIAVHEEKVRDKVVLLVDDVYTTGSTLRECASVLKKAGAKDVRAVTIAQA